MRPKPGIIPIKAEIGNDNPRWAIQGLQRRRGPLRSTSPRLRPARRCMCISSVDPTRFSSPAMNTSTSSSSTFTASEVYEENLGLHAWGGWYNDANIGSWGVWGTPTPIFTGEFTTPEGKLGKVGMAQAIVDGGAPNLIVYAGNDATKKTGDVAVDVEGLVAGDCTAVYAAAEVMAGIR
ncbi:MAG: hypothetical protein MZU97_10075 [Bacillus subtilis]|nr:hypothetical protein [Bacillus subtilis]